MKRVRVWECGSVGGGVVGSPPPTFHYFIHKSVRARCTSLYPDTLTNEIVNAECKSVRAHYFISEFNRPDVSLMNQGAERERRGGWIH